MYKLGATDATKQEYINFCIEAYESGVADLRSLNAQMKQYRIKLIGRKNKVKEVVAV